VFSICVLSFTLYVYENEKNDLSNNL